MSDTTLIQRLHDASQGRDEWRVQSPADGAYCIAFAWPESLDPECEARSWLSDHIKQFPNGRFVDYVVACVRVTSEADQLRIEAADALKQQAAQIEHLKLAEEGAKTAFFHVVQDKDDIAAECKRTHELLHSAHDIIRRDAAKIEALRVQVKQADERGDEALRRAHAGEAEVEALRADAERLFSVFLGVKSDGYGWWLPEWCVLQGETPPTMDQFRSQIDTERAEIDAALRQEQPT